MKTENTSSKYSPETLIAHARNYGSTAKTMRGAVKALIAARAGSGMRGPCTGLQYIDWQFDRQEMLTNIKSLRDRAQAMLVGTGGAWQTEPRWLVSTLTSYLPASAEAKNLSAELHAAVAQLDKSNVAGNYKMSSQMKYDYPRNEAARKSNPEAKRANKDAQFRKNFLRRLATETAKLLAPPVATLAEITAAADSRDVRNVRLAKIAQLRGIALGNAQVALVTEQITAGMLIPITVELARKYGASLNMSGKDATLNETRRTSYGHHVAAVPSTMRNGKWGGFERAEHDNYVRSFALVTGPQTLDYVLHQTVVTVTLPDGVTWATDENGIKAVRGADDYHPTAADLLAKNAGQLIADVLAANAETRKLAASEGLAKLAEMQGVYVCVADSVAAGNCVAGTRSFASRHSLDLQRHYSAMDILAQGNGDTGRVRLAIRAAITRTKKENAQGFAVLADHQISQ